ncbi:tRNA preQ1(34) S-adenosylmethionine ribosyltransferase-isomerase QueA [Breoghania sp.]|uniref:tRNA preQ1(34) S-adenosylmethionine ribosyltransferase-isomerase QueA n=1 Tax=Breoghania sp. TaxID=2065378 RepID=UPI0026330A19|nr:tRNA preQ1(34) S-adenosylmethionine ribosyltransferase-isomerase QueA [Breoghania sp.]MDJ0929849.1 tRNA preQ1(34) S-adenosylmethionine ribosyltransferase-isomerase QueA [Breoghania sp.]
MRVDDFDFELPEDRIALRPARPRDSARQLIVAPGAEPELSDDIVANLANHLRPGDALVFNDTKVIPAQLEGTRERNGSVAHIGVTLHMRVAADRWRAFVRPAKKLQVGERVRFGAGEGNTCFAGQLDAVVVEKGEGGEVEFAFDLSGPDLDIAIATAGHVPLPPYIASKRGEDAQDRKDYQTVYARHDGAVAASTGGLHFTDDLLKRLREMGVEEHFVTLHVGAGTFLPVKVDDVADHHMHSELCDVDAATADALNAVRARGGRIVAVGTTSLRLLESAADEIGIIHPMRGPTDIFITPGYRFRAVDILMTNFHLPRSTLFMLVSAFSGLDTIRRAYAHAIANGYRFYSYGDSSLLFS